MIEFVESSVCRYLGFIRKFKVSRVRYLGQLLLSLIPVDIGKILLRVISAHLN